MKQIDGHQIFLLSEMIGDLHTLCSEPERNGVVFDNEADRNTFAMIVRRISASGLRVAANMIETSRQMVFEADPLIISYDFLGSQLSAVREAIFAELQTMLFFHMDEELRKYFESPCLFGDQVALNFPSASLDIEEGGKCLALGRPTACVFHMMRVMESGLKALGKDLKIPYAPSWESYIRQIDAKITAKHKSKSAKWRAMEPFYRDILGDLMAIKIAWRNPTMHIVRNYIPSEAEDVFRAVRGLMQRLSTRLSQA